MGLNKYIVRFGMWENGPGSGYHQDGRQVIAYSAADAKTQVEVFYNMERNFAGITYIGPVNDQCKCLNVCMCGVGSYV